MIFVVFMKESDMKGSFWYSLFLLKKATWKDLFDIPCVYERKLHERIFLIFLVFMKESYLKVFLTPNLLFVTLYTPHFVEIEIWIWCLNRPRGTRLNCIKNFCLSYDRDLQSNKPSFYLTNLQTFLTQSVNKRNYFLVACDTNTNFADPSSAASSHLSKLRDIFNITNLVKDPSCYKNLKGAPLRYLWYVWHFYHCPFQRTNI